MAKPTAAGVDKHGRKVWLLQVMQTNGKRFTKRYHGTYRDACKQLRELQSAADERIKLSEGKVPFDDYAHRWLSEKADSIAPRTYSGYAREVERLASIIGSTPLDNIDAPKVRSVVVKLRKAIKGRNGTPSESSVKASFKVLSLIMAQAERDDLIKRNPCKRVDAPKADPRERRSMTNEQYTSFRAAAERSLESAYMDYYGKEEHLRLTGHQNKPRGAQRGIHEAAYLNAVLLAHATGARPSELFALQWKHVDFAACGVLIEQATASNMGGIKRTKTGAGVRFLELKPEQLERLSAWRSFQSRAANSLGIELGADSFVICSDRFTQVSHANFNRWWRDWVASIGFEGWEFYELRHTQATLLIHGGGDLHSVKDRMGHSSIAVTEIYTHVDREAQKKLLDILPC